MIWWTVAVPVDDDACLLEFVWLVWLALVSCKHYSMASMTMTKCESHRPCKREPPPPPETKTTTQQWDGGVLCRCGNGHSSSSSIVIVGSITVQWVAQFSYEFTWSRGIEIIVVFAQNIQRNVISPNDDDDDDRYLLVNWVQGTFQLTLKLHSPKDGMKKIYNSLKIITFIGNNGRPFVHLPDICVA